jgi:pyruvate/2-oxoglutarate dehydrogenase complex dihydrolipoamide acyltransferase (E2) component
VSSSPTSTSPANAVEVTMPQMGVSVAEGTIIAWRKQPGDSIAPDETICDIATDKIDTEVPSPVGGTVTELLVAEGETVDVGVAIARIETLSGAPEAAAAVDPPSPTAAPAPAAEPAPKREHRRYSPVVQRIAAEHDIDLEDVSGTGRGGRVRKQDVLALVNGDSNGAGADPPLHIESPYRPDPPAAPATGLHPALAAVMAAKGRPLGRMRRQIGEHMKRSLDTAATCTTWIEVDFSGVEAARARSGLTALPYVARATIVALREHPALNAWLDGDTHTVHEEVNLGIAVSLGEDGLVVPVVHGAHELSEEGLARRIRELARAARNKALSPEDVQGGTFTITNPGQFGSIMATPVINQPQVGILDLEAVVRRVVVLDGDVMAIRPMCVLGLSWDHRALDGVLSARFLAALKRHLEALPA